MFVEALPLIKGDSKFGIIDVYEKFEEHSFDRELRKQTTYVNEIKYTVKDIKEYMLYALEVASKMISNDKVLARTDDEDLKELFDKHDNRK